MAVMLTPHASAAAAISPFRASTVVAFRLPTFAKANTEQVLLQLKLENFRDLDFHFITPLLFQKSDEMRLACRPDPAQENTSCDAYVYYTGYFKNPPP